ncbi:MAG: hypothetical protein AAGD00_07800 [Planctomycetota bacterium]
MGRWILDRRLEEAPLGECWLARHIDCFEPVAAVRLDEPTPENIDLDERLGRLASVELAHTQHVIALERDEDDRPWVIAEYTGHHAGVVRLPDVLAEREGGRLSPNEALQATLQLLEAFADAEASGVEHGAPSIEEVLIDRLGKVRVELFGVRSCLQNSRSVSNDVGDLVAQIARIGYRSLTGMDAGDGAIAPARLVKQTPRHFDRWLRLALDPIEGFRSVREAHAALADEAGAAGPETGVRPVRLVQRVMSRSAGRR